jgi:hypothetical protein
MTKARGRLDRRPPADRTLGVRSGEDVTGGCSARPPRVRVTHSGPDLTPYRCHSTRAARSRCCRPGRPSAHWAHPAPPVPGWARRGSTPRGPPDSSGERRARLVLGQCHRRYLTVGHTFRAELHMGKSVLSIKHRIPAPRRHPGRVMRWRRIGRSRRPLGQPVAPSGRTCTRHQDGNSRISTRAGADSMTATLRSESGASTSNVDIHGLVDLPGRQCVRIHSGTPVLLRLREWSRTRVRKVAYSAFHTWCY